MDKEKIQINIDPDKVEAKYTDQTFISFNPFGFTFDFAQQIPQMGILKIISRFSMSPEHAKALSEILGDTLARYQSQFGPINLSSQMRAHSNQAKGIGFKIQKKEE